MQSVLSIYQSRLSEVESTISSRLSEAGLSTSSFSDLFNQVLSETESTDETEAVTETETVETVSTLTELENEDKYDDLILQAAEEYDLDPNLLKAVMRNESRFKQYALSSAGAQGLMQLMPGTAEDLGVTDPYDAEQNIDAGARYLKTQIDRFGDVRLALAAYNTGPNRVASYEIDDADDEEQYSRISESVRGYVEKVMGYYESYTNQGEFEEV